MFASHDSDTPAHAGIRPAARVLGVREVCLQFRGVQALTDVTFDVNEGEILSIIGPNGAGKTSMLNCISGRYSPTSGDVFFADKNITRTAPKARARCGIGRTFQNLALFAHMSVLENVLVGRHCHMRRNFLAGGVYWGTGAREEEIRHREVVEELIEFFELQHVRHATAGTLAYGLRKRVELARAMALEPRLLLLDEPMAGMNLEEKEDVARYVTELRRERGVTVAMIEHDMGVVMDISDRLVVLNYGRKIAEGTPEKVMADASVRAAYLGSEVA